MGIICEKIIEKLEYIANFEHALSWDNVGLLIGDSKKEINKILVALDATQDVIETAIREKVDLIITHHPIIFSGIKKIQKEDMIGNKIIQLIQHDICCIAMHTNFDVSIMGDLVCQKMHVKDSKPLDLTSGIGKVGIVDEMSVELFANKIKACFNLLELRIYGEHYTTIKKVAIVPGSGKEYIKQAKTIGCDVIITGDVGHHDGLDGIDLGIVVMDAGHFGLEQVFIAYMKQYLEQNFSNISIIESNEASPFWIV
ncbi:MAG: Nif3-like dinuclear metal center hexameric protein [Lachnospiraceae bacterium]